MSAFLLCYRLIRLRFAVNTNLFTSQAIRASPKRVCSSGPANHGGPSPKTAATSYPLAVCTAYTTTSVAFAG